MSLVKETGTLTTCTANTLVDIDDWDDYWEDRDTTMQEGITYTEVQITSALLKAADYLNGLNWKGSKHNYSQGMCWPRVGVYDESNLLWDHETVPDKVKWAQIQLAARELSSSGTLFPNLDRGGRIKRKKTDVLETEWFSSAAAREQFTQIDHLLYGFVVRGPGSKVERS